MYNKFESFLNYRKQMGLDSEPTAKETWDYFKDVISALEEKADLKYEQEDKRRLELEEGVFGITQEETIYTDYNNYEYDDYDYPDFASTWLGRDYRLATEKGYIELSYHSHYENVNILWADGEVPIKDLFNMVSRIKRLHSSLMKED